MHKSGYLSDYQKIDLDRVGRVLIFAILPCSLVIARQSSPAILSLGFLLILLNSIKTRNLSEIGSEIKNNIFRIHYIIIFLFSIFAFTSILWTFDYNTSVHQLIWGFLFPVLVGGVVLALVNKDDRIFSGWALFFGCFVASMLIVFENLSGHLIANSLGNRGAPSDLNHSVITLSIIFWPAFALVRSGLSGHKYKSLVYILFFTSVFVAVFMTVTHASRLALMIGSISFLIVFLLRKKSYIIFGLIVIGVIFIQPVWGDLIYRSVPNSIFEKLKVSAFDRVLIWQGTGAMVIEGPFLGIGFGGSRNITEAPSFHSIEEKYRKLLVHPHPHNNFLQIWLELGVIGAAFLCAFLISITYMLVRHERYYENETFAFFVSTVLVALISHGAWQAWWITAIMVGIIILSVAQAPASENKSKVEQLNT